MGSFMQPSCHWTTVPIPFCSERTHGRFIALLFGTGDVSCMPFPFSSYANAASQYSLPVIRRHRHLHTWIPSRNRSRTDKCFQGCSPVPTWSGKSAIPPGSPPVRQLLHCLCSLPRMPLALPYSGPFFPHVSVPSSCSTPSFYPPARRCPSSAPPLASPPSVTVPRARVWVSGCPGTPPAWPFWRCWTALSCAQGE